MKLKEIKETVNNLVDVIGRILFGIVFLCGVVFVADQTNTLVGKSYAETPSAEVSMPESSNYSSVGYKYERVYINGRYYLVFSNLVGNDIEVIPLDN